MKLTTSVKTGITVFIVTLTSLAASAQEFAGYRSGNYSGVNSAFFNPANIADSRYRWDVSLFGISALVGNNKASFSLKNFGSTFKGDTLKNEIFSSNAGPASGIASIVVNGPSVFFNIGKKSAIAITTQSHILINVVDLDGKLANQLFNSNTDSTGFPYTLSSSQNMIVNVNAYTAFGVSYARILSDKGNNFLKGGITLKYLAGAANGYVNIDNLNTTINEDPLQQQAYLTNSGGSVAMGFGGVNLSGFNAGDLFKFSSAGFGTDIGLVYEYRLHDDSSLHRDQNKYKFRIGLALLNAGSIKYTRDVSSSGSYDIHIPNGQQFYLSALSNAGLDHIKDTLDQYPQFFTENASGATPSYKVSLPTTLQLDIDYDLYKGFYLNLASQFSLTHSIYNSGYYTTLTLTPRYERKIVGVYLPVTYNSLTNLTAGLAIRVGPLYVGSGSILSALFGSSKQADVYVGLQIGILQKNKQRRSSGEN